MKNYTKLFLFLFPILLWSCKDTSGDYIEQIYTNEEMNSAIKSCLTVTKDTAINHLCILNGFNENEEYRIDFPTALQPVSDSLVAHGMGYLMDSLVLKINRSCEMNGNTMTSTFNTVISSIAVTNPETLINGSNSAITDYMKTNYALTLQVALLESFTSQLNTTGALSCLNEIMTEYYNLGGGMINLDLPQYVTNQCLLKVFSEMAVEENLIRTDSQHRVTDILKKVFGDFE